MGVPELSKLIKRHVPNAIKKKTLNDYFGCKIAIDAYIILYQFLYAPKMSNPYYNRNSDDILNRLIMGFFSRIIYMVKNGIQPVFVFDGKPPALKRKELDRRKSKRVKIQQNLDKQAGRNENKRRRLLTVTEKYREGVITLLRYMGIPYINAPSEAEAQCAALAIANKIDGVATEDMDALPFGTPILYRNMTYSKQRQQYIEEYNLNQILTGLNLTLNEFIDMCILMGCDYCTNIKGIGPATALALIRKHKTIEKVLREKNVYLDNDNWPFQGARSLFTKPEIINPDDITLKWEKPDENGLMRFLFVERGVTYNIKKFHNNVSILNNAVARNINKQQYRLDRYLFHIDQRRLH